MEIYIINHITPKYGNLYMSWHILHSFGSSFIHLPFVIASSTFSKVSSHLQKSNIFNNKNNIVNNLT